ncbi:unnamed protein product [Calicophoron daubneyi]|uniref:Coiled-coil domain-containing protein 12 n=1 Tax=Calicophoron daubneyi TaxID=300641 RepID=A0AAV2T227_CALDB
MTTLDNEPDEAEDLNMSTSNSRPEDSSVGRLREEAVRRKERLLLLRKRSLKQNGIESDDEETELPKPVFRNYKPQSKDLKSGELPSAPPVDLTSYVATQLEAANAPVVVEEVNLMNLAPRKPDWDLKRGVEKKLQKLERRTQRAIAELIRERLRNEQSDLASVNS